MNAQAKVYYANKFFPHLTPAFGLLAVEAVLAGIRVREELSLAS